MQKDGEADDQQAYIDNLAQHNETELGIVLVAAVALAEIRLQNVVSVVVDDVAPADNLLSALCYTAGQWDACQQVVKAGIAAFLIVGKVSQDIVIQVALRQQFLVVCQHGVGNQLLVGIDRRDNLAEVYADGGLTIDDAYALHRVSAQTLVLRRVHDTL